MQNDNGDRETIETIETRETREHDSTHGRRRDIIWAKNVLFNTCIVILVCWMILVYIDISPVLHMIMNIFDFMASYMNFSMMVICDMISFMIGILFLIMFVMITITIVLLSCIPFLAFIFVFTNI